MVSLYAYTLLIDKSSTTKCQPQYNSSLARAFLVGISTTKTSVQLWALRRLFVLQTIQPYRITAETSNSFSSPISM